MKTLYLDESGSSNILKIDPCYPIFVLGGVLLEESSIKRNHAMICEFKRKYFGCDDIILHWSDISHYRKDFCILRNKNTRTNFYQDLDELVQKMEFEALICIVRKREWKSKYKDHTIDPYEYALQIIIDKVIQTTRFEDKVKIFAESRDAKSDLQIKLAFQSIRNMGTRFNTPEKVRVKIPNFKTESKTSNISGLQIADLILTPMGRNYIGLNSGDYAPYHETIMKKCIKNKKQQNKPDIIVLPKE